jgi:fructokinase
VSVLVLGETVVDMICRSALLRENRNAQCNAYAGGTAANVAVAAARRGATVALASAVGEDPWGQWIGRKLSRIQGIDLRHFRFVADAATPVTLVTIDPDGEPTLVMYGEGIERLTISLREGLDGAIEACDGFYFASNSLVGEAERSMTLQLRDSALAAGKPVMFDANLRLSRWASQRDAVAACMSAIKGAMLVKCNRAEAQVLTGEDGPERAAQKLLQSDVAVVAVSLGADGAVLCGAAEATAPGVAVNARSALGAGDVLMGVLIAELAQARFQPSALGEALPEAVRIAASTTTRWSAI